MKKQRNKLLKHLWSFLLVFAMVMSVGKANIYAETSSGTTATDKYYNVNQGYGDEPWIVCRPDNNYPGRNQCLSPRLVEGADGALYCTFEWGERGASGEYVFPIYKSINKGRTWEKISEINNDDSIHPDLWLNAQTGEAETENGDGAKLYQWQLHNCPQLFVLPEKMGHIPRGALICAGNAVTIEKDAAKVSDAGDGGLWKTSLDMYYSVDGGVTWSYLSTIAEGGRNIMGYDPIWEPFLLWHENQLICYFSDERVYNYRNNQKLVHCTTTDGIHWSETVDDVAFAGNNKRPGMPIVTKLENGKWMMVYEGVGISRPFTSFFKISDDPLKWNPSETGEVLWRSGSPYVTTLSDGTIAAGTSATGDILLNTKKDGTGTWVPRHTGAPAGYNRCFVQLSSGELLVVGSTAAFGNGQKDSYVYVKSLDINTDLKVDELEEMTFIQNETDGKVAGVWQSSLNAGANVVLWDNTNAADQLWLLNRQTDGTYYIKNGNSGKFMTQQINEEGSNLIQEDFDKSNSMQSWSIEEDDGKFLIKNNATNMYISRNPNSDEVKLILTGTLSGDNSKWIFTNSVGLAN